MLKIQSPHRKVDFFGDDQDKTVLACMLLGWRIHDIAEYTNLSQGQVYYRINRRLGQRIATFRGGHKVCHKFLEILRKGDALKGAEKDVLSEAKIVPMLDSRILK